MAKMFEMMKQATQMRREMKRLQSELEKQTCEYSNGGITAVVRGDMTFNSLKIAPETLRDAKPEQLERLLLQVINGSLKQIRKDAQKHVSKLAGGTGLADLLGQ